MRSRGPGALVVELQASRGHQVDEQRQLAGEVEDQVLAATAHREDLLTLERRQRWVEGLQGIDAGGQRGLDLRSLQGAVKQSRGDLHLRQLGHRPSL